MTRKNSQKSNLVGEIQKMRSGLRSQSKKSIPETTLESIQSCTAKSINSLAQKKRGNKNHSNATENRQMRSGLRSQSSMVNSLAVQKDSGVNHNLKVVAISLPIDNMMFETGKRSSGSKKTIKIKRSKKQKVLNNTALIRDWTIYEGQIIWAKMRGYVWWPARIVNIPCSNEKNKKIDVIFFGDRSTGKLFKNALMPFTAGIEKYEPGTKVLLDKAFKEALIKLREQ